MCAWSRIDVILLTETREDLDEDVVDRLLISDCNWSILAAFAGSWASSADMEKLSPGRVVDSCSRSSWLSIRRT